MHTNKNFVLSLFTKTWIRDSHGLYDYESTQTKNLNAVLADSVIIVRKRHDIKTLATLADLDDEEMLINVKYERLDEYTLENQVQFAMEPTEKNIIDLSNKIWYVLKCDEMASGNSAQTVTNTNEDYYLCKNDIIKLGRVKYALNEIHIPERSDNIDIAQSGEPGSYNISSVNINSSPVFDFIFKAHAAEEGEGEEKMCKICYGDSNERDNPLVHLCNCSGGIRYSHFQCIKKWMETKLQIKENEKKTVKSYNIKSFNCEICKTPYPCKFIIINIL
ncbi:MAG: E3 ubiquitin-protein ligase MARCH [archaeon]|nr:E3 ubiquitin-protein ligase MARCH [archaeon]